jgi:hypothetical protein
MRKALALAEWRQERRAETQLQMFSSAPNPS